MATELGDPQLPLDVNGSTQKPGGWAYISQVNCDQCIIGDFLEIILSDTEREW